MTDAQLYEESFSVTGVLDKQYDRVHRLEATSSDSTTTVVLDINSELYPIGPNETFSLLLASTLNLDGTKDEGQGWRAKSNEASLADMWDYVCHGKVYKIEDPEDGNTSRGEGTLKVYVSFGGLLLQLSGPYKKLSPLKIEYVYLLLKK